MSYVSTRKYYYLKGTCFVFNVRKKIGPCYQYTEYVLFTIIQGCLDDPLSSTGEETKVNVKSSLEEAENIQKKLMVDWPSMCGTWMVGIKHLIQEIRHILLVNGKLIETREETGINVPL